MHCKVTPRNQRVAASTGWQRGWPVLPMDSSLVSPAYGALDR